MKIHEYKESYKGFIAFLVLHFSALIGTMILSVIKDFLPLVLIANIITVGMTLLMYIIYVSMYTFRGYYESKSF